MHSTRSVDQSTYSSPISYMCKLPQVIWKHIQGGCRYTVSKIEAACLEVSYTAQKIDRIFTRHYLKDWITSSPSIPNSTILTKAKNISQKSVIWKETDRKQALLFKEALIHSETTQPIRYLDDEGLQTLHNFTPQRIIYGGICFGATLQVIRTILTSHIQSEGKLIELIDSCKNGFSKEAGGLQHIHEALGGWNPKLTDESKQKLVDYLEQERTLYIEHLEKEIEQLIKTSNKESLLQHIQ